MKVKEINKIKGFEHINDGYYVSYDGRVFSLRDKHGNVSFENKHELKQSEKTGGYLYVTVTTKHNKLNYIRVNRLVAKAFVKGETMVSYTARPGFFALFLPGEPHAPGIALTDTAEKAKKVVFKIKV